MDDDDDDDDDDETKSMSDSIPQNLASPFRLKAFFSLLFQERRRLGFLASRDRRGSRGTADLPSAGHRSD